MTADFKQLFKDRDTAEVRRIPARLLYRAPEGEEGEVSVELATRGHSRLTYQVCEFPPIRVYLPPREERPPLWRGQHALKLTVNCKPRDRRYEQFLLEEYLIYRIYNLFTDLSYRVRLARGTYIQEAKGDTVAATWAFFVEDADDLARRHGGEDHEEPGVRFRDVDEKTMALMAVFEYLIGNTDWGLPVLHNVRVLKLPPGVYYPVPYDFDFSGLIKTPYAGPSRQLSIRSVRERLYRGPCLPMDAFQPIFAIFNEKRPEIEALFKTTEGLDPKRVESHLGYIGDFYQTISNPGKVDREFRYVCG
ncbi:MAG TPA: hypothetical protein VGA42_01775 [Gemmatimonadales bacterium]